MSIDLYKGLFPVSDPEVGLDVRGKLLNLFLPQLLSKHLAQQVPVGPMERGSQRRVCGSLQNINLGDSRQLVIGGKAMGWDAPMRAEGAFDELRVYDTALDGDQIASVYRATSPLDVVVDRRFLRSGEAERIAVELWPGGALDSPQVGAPVETPIDVSLELILLDNQQSTVARLHHVAHRRGDV